MATDPKSSMPPDADRAAGVLPAAPQSVFRVVLQPQDWRYSCAHGQTVLQAAIQAGIRLPSSCRNGTCRTCMCRMRQGAVRYTAQWPGLSADEKAEGWILPCVAVPVADLALEVPDAQVLVPRAPPTGLTGARRG